MAKTMKRLSSPSTVTFADSVICIVDAGAAADSFGRMPSSLGALAWVDRRGSVKTSIANHGLAAQIGAVLTLSANRRIQVAAADLPVSTEQTRLRTFLPIGHGGDPSLAPVPDDLKDRFEELIGALWGPGEDDPSAARQGPLA